MYINLLNFCNTSGVLRTIYLLKILIKIIFVIVPIILIIKVSTSFFKVVITGNQDTLKKELLQTLKSTLAAIIIFFIPTIVNYTFTSFVDYDDTSFVACYNNANLATIKKLEEEELETAEEKLKRDDIDVGQITISTNKGNGDAIKTEEVSELNTYSSLKVLKTITEEDLYDKVIVQGHDGLTAAQSMTVIDEHIITAQVNSSKNNKTLFQVINKNTLKKENEFYGYSLVHSGGMTYNENTNEVTVSHGHGTKDISTFTLKNITGNTKITNKTTKHLNSVGSGMAYDSVNNVYLSNSKSSLYVYDTNFNYLKTIPLIRKYACQDMTAYNGIAIVTQFQHQDSSQPRNGLDFYRISDGAYLGSYNIPINRLEIESIAYSGSGNKFFIFFGITGKKDELYSLDIYWNDFK